MLGNLQLLHSLGCTRKRKKINENFPGWKTLNLTELLNFTPCCDFSDTLKNSSGDPPNSTLLTPFWNSVKSVNPTRSSRGQSVTCLYCEGCSLGHWRSWADFAFYQEVGHGALRKRLIPIHLEGWLNMYSWFKYALYKLPKWWLHIHPLILIRKLIIENNRALFAKMESLKHLPHLKIELDFF